MFNLTGTTALVTGASGGIDVGEPRAEPRYSMAELLGASDYAHEREPEEREWLDAPAVGRELL